MERKKVSSSNLESVGYLYMVLEIEFKNGNIYQFKNVPERIYKQLMKSSSKGTFFYKNIRGKFLFDQIK
jgi:hypothetical protein